MVQFLSGVVVGVFVGALTIELLGRRHPDLIDRIHEKSRRAADAVENLFRRYDDEEVGE